jgi:sugar transferase (PEP-CTERM/EpsH1 system associated)
MLVSRFPWPLEKGDKLRAYYQLKGLAQKHEVFLCCLSDAAVDDSSIEELRKIVSRVEVIRLSKWLIALSLLRAVTSRKPFQVHYFLQWHAKRKVQKIIQQFEPEHIYCQLIRTSEYVKFLYQYPKTIDYMDALNAGMRRRAESATFWMRPLLQTEARRLVAYEHLIYDYFDHHTIISEQDRELIYHSDRANIAIVPNGVDSSFFESHDPIVKDIDLVFSGNMGYAPNIDCARRLVLEIMPMVWKEMPHIRVMIAGASPDDLVSSLASDHVIVTGWMNDIRIAYRRARVFIAPMRIGSGLQNKLLEAMSCEIPCITSPLSANAMGKNQEGIIVKESNEEFAQAILDLIKQPEMALELGKAARQNILKNFQWDSSNRILNHLISESKHMDHN